MDRVAHNRLLCAIVLFLAFKCMAAVSYRATVATGDKALYNFGVYRAAAQRLDNHQTIYFHETGPKLMFQHSSSPLLPLLERPLDRFSTAKAFQIWVGMNVAAMLMSVVLYCWATGVRILDDPVPVLLAVLTAFRYWPTVIELGTGNTDVLQLMLICGMLVCARYGRWILYAVLVAIGALTKTWMIGTLFYLLVRRKWMAAAASVVFFVAGGAVLFTMIGWKEFPLYLEVTKRYSTQDVLFSHSVAGIARELFTANPAMTPIVQSPVLHLGLLVIGYGYLMIGLAYIWWKGPKMSEYQLRLSMGLMAIALILGSTISHQYYFVLALPLLWTLLIGDGGVNPQWWVKAGAFVIYLIFSVPTPGDPLPDAYKHGGIKALEVAITFAAGMSLWTLGLYALIREFSTSGQRATAPPAATLPLTATAQ